MSGLSEVFPCMHGFTVAVTKTRNLKERLLAERGLEAKPWIAKKQNTYFLDERFHTDPKTLVSIVDDTLEYSDEEQGHQNP